MTVMVLSAHSVPIEVALIIAQVTIIWGNREGILYAMGRQADECEGVTVYLVYFKSFFFFPNRVPPPTTQPNIK